MKVGVTGASGFIGRKLTKKLLDSGYEVKNLLEENLNQKMKFTGVLQRKRLIKINLKNLMLLFI